MDPEIKLQIVYDSSKPYHNRLWIWLIIVILTLFLELKAILAPGLDDSLLHSPTWFL